MQTTTTPSGTGRARLGLIVSMTVFGTIGLFVRRIEITSAELALCRAGLAAAFLLLYFLVTRRHLRLSEIKKSLWLLLASGAAMGINWMLLFEAYKFTTISLATLSYYLAPVLVTALCPLLFHERMTRTLEFQLSVGANLGLRRVHRKRQFRPGKNTVQLREHRIVDGQVLPMPRDLAGELGEYPLDFLTFFDKELSQRVVAVHSLHGLNEKRAAGRRHVVNQTRNRALALGFHRHDAHD